MPKYPTRSVLLVEPYFFAVSDACCHYLKREKLVELASPEGADLLYDYCIREKKTYVEVLLDFPSVCLSLDTLLHLIPRQRPRSYSIASSYLMHPDKVSVKAANRSAIHLSYVSAFRFNYV